MLIYLLCLSLFMGERMACILNCDHACDIVDRLQIEHIGFICEDDITIEPSLDGKKVVWVDPLANLHDEAEMQIEDNDKMYYAITRIGPDVLRINLANLIDEAEVFELSDTIVPAFVDRCHKHHKPQDTLKP